METELPVLLNRHVGVRPEFTFHSARMRMRQVNVEQLSSMNRETSRAASELADMRPDVVATACLVAIMAQGQGRHLAVEAEIAEVLAKECAAAPVVSSAGALIDALHELGARRIALITPYVRGITQMVVDYIEESGFEVHDAISLEIADNCAVGALDPMDLCTHWRRLDLRNCDALVLSACVQMPSLPAIEIVERACGLPTLTASVATAWGIMRALDVEPVVTGAGALLAGARA
jgi:maleate isomerase